MCSSVCGCCVCSSVSFCGRSGSRWRSVRRTGPAARDWVYSDDRGLIRGRCRASGHSWWRGARSARAYPPPDSERPQVVARGAAAATVGGVAGQSGGHRGWRCASVGWGARETKQTREALATNPTLHPGRSGIQLFAWGSDRQNGALCAVVERRGPRTVHSLSTVRQRSLQHDLRPVPRRERFSL